jgi:hypothetical protein
MKRLIVPGLVALLALGLFAVAVAGAQEGSPEPSPTEPSPTQEANEEDVRPFDNFLDRLAENLGISREELDETIDETQIELIDEAVAEGRLDEEKAADLKERIENGEPVFPGFGFHGGVEGAHRPFAVGIHWIIETAAELLSIEESELRQRFGEGESLAEMAEAEGIDIEQFKSDLLAAADAKLDEKVADGDLTQEQAGNIYERFSENIDDIISREHVIEFNGPGFGESFRMEIAPDGEMPPIEGIFPFFDAPPIPDTEKEESDTDA